jgi:hypothetical protein
LTAWTWQISEPGPNPEGPPVTGAGVQDDVVDWLCADDGVATVDEEPHPLSVMTAQQAAMMIALMSHLLVSRQLPQRRNQAPGTCDRWRVSFTYALKPTSDWDCRSSQGQSRSTGRRHRGLSRCRSCADCGILSHRNIWPSGSEGSSRDLRRSFRNCSDMSLVNRRQTPPATSIFRCGPR